MQKLITLLVCLFSLTILQAQDTKGEKVAAVSRPENKTVKDTLWKKGGEGKLDFSHTNFGNWTQGALNATTAIANITMFGHYKKAKVSWDNDARFTLGFVNTEGINDWRKADDVIRIQSKLGYGISKKLNWSVLGAFDSQFAPTLNFTGDTIPGSDYKAPAIARFLSPAFISIGTGLDYKPTDWISVYFSPATFRALLVLDQDIANLGLYGNRVENGIGDKFKPEMGAQLIGDLKKEVVKNVTFLSHLELFSNILNNRFGETKPQNIDILWINSLRFTVNKFIAATVENTLRYDDEVVVVKNRGEADQYNGKSLQTKSFFGIGLTYKFL
ncbi:MAG: DUF3078 domain-containing protein [Sphingobacteriales bacterium]|nr:MAG: DUF3078 domain-containing protein [Sphingobacteriales bacterium]